MPDLIDFDAFRAENLEEPVHLKIGGKVYDLPPSIPAMVALDIIRLQMTIGAKADVPPQVLNDMGTSLFGPEHFREIVDVNRLTVKELGELITHVLQVYSGVALPNQEARRRAKKSHSR